MNFIITFLVCLSYFYGAKAIYQGNYYPSIYSRVIWLLLAISSFVSVVLLNNDPGVMLLSGLSAAGCLVMMLLALRKSRKAFGSTELVATILLFVSIAVWFVTKSPFLNLSIVLIAYFIGGIPTYIKVLKNPKDENIRFWLFFAIASWLTLIQADKASISGYIYPLFFALFDGGMTLLCLRRYSVLTLLYRIYHLNNINRH